MLIIRNKHRTETPRYENIEGEGVFDSLIKLVTGEAAKNIAKKASAEVGNKVLKAASAKVGDVVSEKIVNEIDKLTKSKKPSKSVLDEKPVKPVLNDESQAILTRLLNTPKKSVKPEEVYIDNILEGSGQSIAIEKLARKLNRLSRQF